jgi:hypothetical protein
MESKDKNFLHDGSFPEEYFVAIFFIWAIDLVAV